MIGHQMTMICVKLLLRLKKGHKVVPVDLKGIKVYCLLINVCLVRLNILHYIEHRRQKTGKAMVDKKDLYVTQKDFIQPKHPTLQ